MAAADSLTKIRLSVWRDFVPRRALLFRLDGNESRQLLPGESELQQEIYTWNMREDPFGGVSDENARRHLRELLIDRFEAQQPPSKRRFEELGEFLAEAQRIIDSDQAEWANSQEDEDPEVPYRLNPLLALKVHLEWLSRTFSGQPGISVSIR